MSSRIIPLKVLRDEKMELELASNVSEKILKEFDLLRDEISSQIKNKDRDSVDPNLKREFLAALEPTILLSSFTAFLILNDSMGGKRKIGLRTIMNRLRGVPSFNIRKELLKSEFEKLLSNNSKNIFRKDGAKSINRFYDDLRKLAEESTQHVFSNIFISDKERILTNSSSGGLFFFIKKGVKLTSKRLSGELTYEERKLLKQKISTPMKFISKEKDYFKELIYKKSRKKVSSAVEDILTVSKSVANLKKNQKSKSSKQLRKIFFENIPPLSCRRTRIYSKDDKKSTLKKIENLMIRSEGKSFELDYLRQLYHFIQVSEVNSRKDYIFPSMSFVKNTLKTHELYKQYINSSQKLAGEISNKFETLWHEIEITKKNMLEATKAAEKDLRGKNYNSEEIKLLLKGFLTGAIIAQAPWFIDKFTNKFAQNAYKEISGIESTYSKAIQTNQENLIDKGLNIFDWLKDSSEIKGMGIILAPILLSSILTWTLPLLAPSMLVSTLVYSVTPAAFLKRALFGGMLSTITKRIQRKKRLEQELKEIPIMDFLDDISFLADSGRYYYIFLLTVHQISLSFFIEDSKLSKKMKDQFFDLTSIMSNIYTLPSIRKNI